MCYEIVLWIFVQAFTNVETILSSQATPKQVAGRHLLTLLAVSKPAPAPRHKGVLHAATSIRVQIVCGCFMLQQGGAVATEPQYLLLGPARSKFSGP